MVAAEAAGAWAMANRPPARVVTTAAAACHRRRRDAGRLRISGCTGTPCRGRGKGSGGGQGEAADGDGATERLGGVVEDPEAVAHEELPCVVEGERRAEGGEGDAVGAVREGGL